MADADDYSDDEHTGKKKSKFDAERPDHDERSKSWSNQAAASHAGRQSGLAHRSHSSNRTNTIRNTSLYNNYNKRPPDTRDRSPSSKRLRGNSDKITVSSTYIYQNAFYTKNIQDNRPRYDGNRPHIETSYRGQFSVDQSILSFKAFCSTLPSDVDESEAIKKYEEYKSDLNQTKVEKFFDVHKDEEWFRIKYHPEDRQKRIMEQTENMKIRLELFKELLDTKFLDKISLDIDRTDEIVQIMDIIVLKLEGQTKEYIRELLKDIFSANKKDTNGHTEVKKEQQKSSESPSKQAYKKNLSIVLENLPTDITKAEILDLCKDREGLIRVSLTDPYYIEGGQIRRKAFATFRSDVDIKDICIACKFRKIKVRNCEVEASINRELTKRVRPVNGITNHKSVVLNDLKNAATIILNFDDQRRAWDTSNEQSKEHHYNKSHDVKKPCDGFEEGSKCFRTYGPFVNGFSINQTAEDLEFRLQRSKNPLLDNMGIYLVEETNTEEYELLGYAPEGDSDKDDIGDPKNWETFERSEEHIAVLDKMILYLRIVHSFDYYNHTEYKLEDDMPNRLGIMHVRGPWPPVDSPDSQKGSASAVITNPLKLSKDVIDGYINDFNNKIKIYTHGRPDYDMPEEDRLIIRDFDVELNNDLESCVAIKTTSKQQKEVYECKHCKKKFEKKMEFLKKHVLTKHQEATAVILADVDFFNSYLFDPHRIEPVPPKELMETSLNDSKVFQNDYEKDPMTKAEEDFAKLDEFVKRPAPRGPSTMDPRAATLVDYGDISFDDAI